MQFGRRSKVSVLLTLVFMLLLHYFFDIVTMYNSHYNNIVHLPINTRRNSSTALRIAVVIVVNQTADIADYSLAHSTINCYCKYHQYPLILIDFSRNESLKELCPQNDMMFSRHCAVRLLLQERLDLDWILFLDADMGVVNPNHLIEDYIQPSVLADLIFYQRIFNFEIMAGSYLARRSEFTLRFLESWANAYYELPASFHGSDNGAIHYVFMKNFGDTQSAKDMWPICKHIWQTSKNWDDLERYTSCSRAVLGEKNIFRVHGDTETKSVYLITNPIYAWARDGWLTKNKWSSRDFIFHGWQKKYFGKHFGTHASWNSPLKPEHSFQIRNCGPESANAHFEWPYKDTFMSDNQHTTKLILETLRNTVEKHLNRLKSVYALKIFL